MFYFLSMLSSIFLARWSSIKARRIDWGLTPVCIGTRSFGLLALWKQFNQLVEAVLNIWKSGTYWPKGYMLLTQSLGWWQLVRWWYGLFNYMDEDLPMLNGACPDRLFFRGSLVGRLRPFMILSSRWLALKFFFPSFKFLHQIWVRLLATFWPEWACS